MADSKDSGTSPRSGSRAKTGAGKPAKSAAGSGAAGKAGGTAKPAKAASTAPRAKARTSRPDLKKDLRDFASARPQGWNHEDWLNFLESLEGRGHDIADREAIGTALERERLHVALGTLKGIGPQKRQSLVDYYGTMWQLRHADPDEIARIGNIPRKDAERIKSELR